MVDSTDDNPEYAEWIDVNIIYNKYMYIVLKRWTYFSKFKQVDTK